MSEQRKISKGINPQDLNLFKRIAIAKGLKIENKTTVKDWYGRTITDKAIYTIGNEHSKLRVGVDLNGNLYYDNLTAPIVNELLADYYENKLSRKGYTVKRIKDGSKVRLEVYK